MVLIGFFPCMMELRMLTYDVDVEIMELSHVFRTRPRYNSESAFLTCMSNPFILMKAFPLDPVWRAGNWDNRRNIPFELLKPLFDVAGATIYILQGEAKEAGWKEGKECTLGELSLYDYARLVKGLDLLISIDSMPVHLAGALGVPVWNLLHADADWRWMRNRNDSPWYPTMRIFRQQEQGKWQTVIEKVKDELEKMIVERNIR